MKPVAMRASRKPPVHPAYAAPDVVFMSSQAFLIAGTVSAGWESYVAGNVIPNAGTTNCQAHMALPPNWAGKKARVAVYWRAADNDAGTVKWDVYLTRIKDATYFITPFASETNVLDATPADVNKAVVTIFNPADALPSDIGENELLNVNLVREGGNASDTYNAAIYLLGATVSVRST